jgi:hypothetical protein
MRSSPGVNFESQTFDDAEEAEMKLQMKFALTLGALALALVPATALAVPDYQPVPPHYTPGHTPPGHTPGATPGPPAHAKAYGKHCQGQSKKHVKGVQGTAFSRCVKAMARADKEATLTARKACKALSKKHVKGTQGTPFSRCVKGVAQMRKEAAAAVTSRAVA